MGEIAISITVAKSMLKRLEHPSLHSHKVYQLKDPVANICNMLLDAENKRISDRNSVDRVEVNNWVEDVSKTLLEADDLVDAAATALAAVLKVHYCRSLFGLAKNGTRFISGLRMGPEIKRFCFHLTELEQVAANDIGLVGSGIDDNQSDLNMLMSEPFTEVETAGYEQETQIVGREEDRERVLELLLDTRTLGEDISVVTIVGIGGIGKTTLAQSVYHDERVTNHFDVKLWVDASEFDPAAIIRSIITSFSAASETNNLKLDQLIGLLRGIIGGKMFLLVLDDVWNGDRQKWLSLRSMLTVGARGSKILMTSRNKEVARIAGSLSYKLQALSMEKAWFLFRNIAFHQSEPSAELLTLGKKIFRLCTGVPLVTKMVAYQLRWRSEDQWRSALSELVDISVNNQSMPAILMWSYNNLILSLKVCFAYCSVFPEDSEINAVDLVSLWLAQGFFEPVDENGRDLEDIGEECFLALSRQGFFINEKMDEDGNVKTFKIHDLMLDLAQDVGKVFGTMMHTSLIRGTMTHTSLIRGTYTIVPQEKKLCKFFLWNKPEYVRMMGIKSLRVLDLHGYGIQVLPTSVGNLIHLRYLDLSDNGSLAKLPNSITNLHNLQTLILNFCYELEELPTSTRKLVCLRRLEIDRCDKLTFMPPGFENLSSLRKLSRFVVGRPRFQSTSGIKSLRNLNHLRGRLMIEFSENWTAAVGEASKSSLIIESRLTELGIKWHPTSYMSVTDAHQHQELLDNLQPPPSLKTLQIEGYRGHNFPSWAITYALATILPNLITISIDGCAQCEILPSLSQLRFLKHLTLRFMDNVQFIESSDNQSSSTCLYFPSLQELTLHSFYSLKGWREKKMSSLSFDCLQKLSIWSCPKLTFMPLFPNVEVLDLQNINKKLFEVSDIWIRGSEIQKSMQPSSSNSEITNYVPRGHPRNLPLLKTLHIKGCPNLETLALGKYSKELKKMVIEKLDMLSSLTEDLKHLTSLEELEITSCKDLDLSGGCHGTCGECGECSVPWIFLSKLHRLTIRELPKLVTLPVGLSFIKTLKVLCISTCNSLSVLPEWVSKITSLQHLRLEGCPALTMLPEELKGILSLVKVDIIECPKLMERCKEHGEDWHKIKHARVLCHKSWRYALMSEAELRQNPKNPGENVVVRSEDPTIHVDVTVRRQAVCRM